MRSLLLLAVFGLPLHAVEVPISVKLSVSGTVKEVSQVVARFPDSMVPFGDPTVTSPFDVKCSGLNPEPKELSDWGSSRWLGPKEWAFDFKVTLPAGVKCEFNLKDGVKTLAGKKITIPGPMGFDTGGPAIRQSRPWEGGEVEEDQIFVFNLDSQVDKSSAEKNAYFEIEGQGNRVGFRWVTGNERKAILNAAYQKNAKEDTIVVAADQKFPANTKIGFVWGKGIKSLSGVATTQDQVYRFTTRKTFAAEFRCERENVDAGCSPVGWMSLNFNGSLRYEDAKKIRIRGEKGGELIKEESKEPPEWVNGVTFKPPFPERGNFLVELPSGIKDEAGRPLSNADKFPLKVKTDRFPPLAKFAASFGILEAGKNALLPVTVRNLEPDVKTRLFRSKSATGISFDELDKVEGRKAKVGLSKKIDMLNWIRRIENHTPASSIFDPQLKQEFRYANEKVKKEYEPAPEKVAVKPFPIPRREKAQSFEVVGIPMDEPGFYVVEVASRELGEALIAPKQSYHAPTAVLVTDLAVHFKWGQESSLAWVTRLKDGQPVAGAAVEVMDCHGKVVDNGTSDALGLVSLKKVPKVATTCQKKGSGVYHRFFSGYFVVAELKNDMAFVHTSMSEGIEPWRFSLPTNYDQSALLAHSVLDRTLLRAGETVHIKSFLRKHSVAGIEAISAEERPVKVRISHTGTDQKYEFPAKWEAAGYTAMEWKIPKDAKLGTYRIDLLGGPKSGKANRGAAILTAGTFRVEEFRVPLLKATVTGQTPPPIRPKSLSFDVAVNYLAGGPAAALAVKLRTQEVERFSPSFDEFEGYTFANGPVKVGREKRGQNDDDEERVEQEKKKVTSQEGALDASGAKRFDVKGLTARDVPFQLMTEVEYADPNGEIQTAAMAQTIYPSGALVGIKTDSWLASKDALKIAVAVANQEGKPLANRPVKVALYERKTFSHRKRLLGGYYAYENTTETKKLGAFCDGETNVRGILICEAKPPQSGNLIAEATVTDAKGNASFVSQDVWVPGAEDWWFPVSDNDRMDVIPERKRYEPGEKAKLQVRVPFREATLLVTMEREGVLESFVQKVSGKAPVIEVPISNRYAPNVYVSVLAVRGRSDEAKPTATVDLGKPAYKLGIAQIDVGWGHHQLKVKVETPKTVYRVRDKVVAELTVQDSKGRAVKDADVAVAAVDEGLLNLMPNDSWDLLTAMMNRRPYEVETSTASMHVIGKRHFGLKALPSGGGGGQPTRELFETLLFWKASVRTNAKGKATVTIPLNDSLTSFRIVAIAAADADKFGTGKTTIRSNQDLMLFSGVSPLVREGDNTEALLTLRNASEASLTVNASAQAEGVKEKLAPKKMTLKPGESRVVAWPVTVPQGVSQMKYVFEAQAGKTRDKLKVTQKVVPAVPVRVLQATLEQVDKPFELPVEIPKTALPGVGGIRVDLQPTLLAGAESIRSFMKQYPYTCFEQETSRAVALRDPKLWGRLVKVMPLHQDGEGLLKFFPTMRWGSETLTAYVLAVSHEAGWEIPAENRATMQSGLKAFVSGSLHRESAVAAADLVLRKVSALEALSRYDANLETSLLKSIEVSPNLWPTSTVIEWRNVLKREAAYPNRDKELAELNNILRSRFNYNGTSLGFSTEKADALWWLMASADTNSVRAILSFIDDKEWKEDLPRILRGAIARQQKGHWDLTLANAWGVLALEKFSKQFEAGEVKGNTSVAMNDKSANRDWSQKDGKQVVMAWPLAKSTVAVRHQGSGKPWAIFQSLAALPLKEPLSSGFRIEKTVTPVERKKSGQWSVGDILRVNVKVKADGDQAWVVVNDPIPAGASLLGSGLGNSSALLTQGEKSKGWAYPAFTERSFEGYRAYYEWVEKGEFSVEYTIRLNGGGNFGLPPTRVEAMYRPEIFAETPNVSWEVVR